ncbi:MAG: hypothetical protein IT318_19080, partial [Anaerolineales bacterium]|nr:hypothetical protein [Anaerolineales bacterium]
MLPRLLRLPSRRLVTMLGLVLVIALAACRRAAPPTTAPDAATQTPPATALPTEDLSILYEDDFSDDDSGWP